MAQQSADRVDTVAYDRSGMRAQWHVNKRLTSLWRELNRHCHIRVLVLVDLVLVSEPDFGPEHMYAHMYARARCWLLRTAAGRRLAVAFVEHMLAGITWIAAGMDEQVYGTDEPQHATSHTPCVARRAERASSPIAASLAP